jgi:ankyrin repeat protein
MLAKGVDVNMKDRHGFTPLGDAASRGNGKIIELLLANGADVNTKDNVFGRTPLHCAIDGPKSPSDIAAASPKKKVVELLLTSGADVNAEDSYGDTPLDYAVQIGDSDVKELLRKYGAP